MSHHHCITLVGRKYRSLLSPLSSFLSSRSTSLSLNETAMATASASEKPFFDVNDAAALFEKFVKDYDKQYKDEADREEHYQAFIRSLHRINELNAKQSTATYGINKFADYTEEETKQMRGVKK